MKGKWFGSLDLAKTENTEFEEKVDIDDLVFPSKSINLSEIEIQDIKEEPLEEEEQHVVFESNHDLGMKFKLKMEENILKLYEELDIEKPENSIVDFSLRRSLKIRQFVEKAYEDKTNNINNIKQELQSVKVTNQELIRKIRVQELEMSKNTFANNDSLERNFETKPFLCKYCEKCFLQLNEVKEHIRIHMTTSEVKDSTTISIYSEDCVTNDLSTEKAHEKKKPFKCHVCYYNFSSKTNLNCHIATIHGGKKSNDKTKKEKAGSEQNKKKRKDLEKAEEERESKMRKNTCGFCSKDFFQNQKLVYHVATVHEGKKPFKCDIVINETVHEREATKKPSSKRKKGDFMCEMCKDTFALKQGLKRHITNVHEKRKPFKCDSCDYTCSLKQSLERHTSSAHEKRTFFCSVCNEEFTRNYVRTKHEGKCTKKK